MGYKFDSIIHVVNTIKFALRKQGIEFTKKEEDELFELVVFSWDIQHDDQMILEMNRYRTHFPINSLTWWAFKGEYTKTENFLKFANDFINQYRVFIRAIKNNNVRVDNPSMNLIFKSAPYEIEDYIKTRIERNVKDEFIKNMSDLRNKSGVYFLYDGHKKLIYVGKSVSLGERLVQSIVEKSAYFYEYALTKTKSDTNIYESYYISTLKPKRNVEGKYPDQVTVTLPCIRNKIVKKIYK